MQEDAFTGSRVLVTGGAGFLGSNLVKRLTSKAETVWVLDDLYTGRRDVIPDEPNVIFVQGSILDGALLRELLSGVDYVFHFAARNITLSASQPETDFTVNTEGTVQLLLNALPFKDRIRRLIYASTSSIYGNCTILPARESMYDVTVPYAASKFAGELFAIAYSKMYQLPVTCLRFSNVYGPGQYSTNPYCGVVSKFMNAIVEGHPLTIFGDGSQTRDFTFVDDAMDAVLAAAASQETGSTVFNVGTGREVTINELAQQVLLLIPNPEYPIKYATKRPIDTVHRRSVDSSKLQDVIQWTPQHSMSDGLNKTWTWFQETAQR